jgi:hypothetical protein
VYWSVISVDFGASVAASLLASLLSADRCLALVRPLHHRRICTVRRTGIVAASVSVLAIIFGFNYTLRFSVTLPGRTGAYTVEGIKSAIGDIHAFAQACAFLDFILRFALPLTIMAVSNTWTLAVIRQSERFRKTCASVQTDQKSSPKCLATTVGLVVVFVCTQLVLGGISFDGILFGRLHRGTLLVESIFISGNVLAKANSVVNFFVYFGLSREFRHELLVLFRCRSKKAEEKQMNTISSHVSQN